ncbi:RAMP superfamily CRISPR-associated protein [Thermosphaera sp.]
MYVLLIQAHEPISYGEESVGIKTLIKKVSILLPERHEIIEVPVIFGNGVRGVLRDVLAYTFLNKVVEVAKNRNESVEVDARLLLLMLTGGVLRRREETPITAKEINDLKEKVKLLPPLNIMGFAIANVMVPSKIKVSTFYPICSETYDLVGDLIDKIENDLKNYIGKFKEIPLKKLVSEIQMMHKDDVSRLVNVLPQDVKVSNIDKIDTMRGTSLRVSEGEGSEKESTREREKSSLQALFQREYVLPGTLYIGYISEIVPLAGHEIELLKLAIENISGLGGAVTRGFGAFKMLYSDFEHTHNKEGDSELKKFIEDNFNKILSNLKTNPEEWLGTTNRVESG